MTTFKEFAGVHESAATTGTRVRIRDYLALNITENGLTVTLVILMLVSGGIGFFSKLDADQRAWAFHSTDLCLGVFLGLFAGGRKKA